MPVSFNTRKGLGRRYGIDPALLYAQQELENKYSLIPGQEQRTLERERMSATIDAQNQQGKQAGISSMIGAAGNLYGIKMMADAYAGKGTGMFGTSTAVNPATKGIATGGLGAAGATGSGATGAMVYGSPEYIAAGGNMAPLSAAELSSGLGGMSAGGLATTGAAVAGAGYLGGQLGQPIGEAIGAGGEKERGAVGGALAGAAAGAAMTSWSGPGAAVGAVIGGVVGLVSGGKGTWICTATNKHVGTSKEQKASMKKLRRYAKDNFPGWLEFYNQNGPNLIMEIEDQEPDLVLFYNIVKRKLVEPCVLLIDKGDLKGAFDLYKKKTEELFKEYAPDIEVKEA